MTAKVGKAVEVSEGEQSKATAAKEVAAAVAGSLEDLRGEVDGLKGVNLKDEIEKDIEKEWLRLGGKGTGKAQADPWARYKGDTKQKGKGSANSMEIVAERRYRTITFGHFPPGTKSETIKDFMDSKLTKHQEDVEESFPYGKNMQIEAP